MKCASCHAAEPGVVLDRRGVSLHDIGARATPEWIREFLTDPQSAKPGTTMPHVLHGLSNSEREENAQLLVQFLASLGGPFETNPEPEAIPGQKKPKTPFDPPGATFPLQARAGDSLFHSVGCVACHEPEWNLSNKWSLPRLAKFLRNPHEARPSGRMPSLHLDRNESKAIAAYLVRDQSGDEARTRGLHYAAALGDWAELPETLDDVPFVFAGELDEANFDSWKTLPREQLELYPTMLFVIRGDVEVKKAGVHEFHIRDVQDVRLSIGGNAITPKKNKIDLKAGRHQLEFVALSKGKRGRIEWQPPGAPKRATITHENLSRTYRIPAAAEFKLDESCVLAGQTLFQEMRCNACHETKLPSPGSSPVAGYERLHPETLTGFAAENSNWGGNEGPEKAFDDNPKTKYLNKSRTPSGVLMEFGRPVTISGWMLTSANDHEKRDPARYLLEGSRDGEVFEKVADEPVGQFGKRHESKTLFFANKSAYPIYRLTFLATREEGADGTQLSEIAPLAKTVAGLMTAGLDGIKPLAELDASAAAGCIGENPGADRPAYTLTDSQREAIRAALGDLKPPTGEVRITRHLTAYGCFNCHERGGIGGPAEDMLDFFTNHVEVDLGDEGRFPPALDLAGAKFTRAGLNAILVDGQRVRPHMATRMPAFGASGTGDLIDALLEVDSPKIPSREPVTSGVMAVEGRKLVGNTTLACVNCHSWGDRPSLGIPGVNLSTITDRVTPGWFHAWLTNPHKIRPNTRMPPLWVGGQSAFPDILGGDPEKQMDAIWAYLAAKQTLPAPAGLQDSNFGKLLEVGEEPVTFRTFISQVGAHAIAVGFPEEVNVAFDANGIRMAAAWVGPFLSTKETWDGRAGQYAKIPSRAPLTFPAGPVFAMLESPETAWPEDPEHAQPSGRPANRVPEGWQFRGYRFDEKRVPTFLYRIGEGLEVEETPVAFPVEGEKSTFERRFKIGGGESAAAGWFVRLATGKEIVEDGGEFVVDGREKHRVTSAKAAFVREGDGQMELFVPVGNEITQRITW